MLEVYRLVPGPASGYSEIRIFCQADTRDFGAEIGSTTCLIVGAGPDGEDEPEYLGITKAACRYMTPKELYLDLVVAARS